MKKLSLEDLLGLMDDHKAQICRGFIKENSEKLSILPGSVKKHQSWEGGYMDHILEIMNIAYITYEMYDIRRKLPFSLSDALFVLFFHDFDKLERYVISDGEIQADKYQGSVDKIKAYFESRWQYSLTPKEYNAFKYTHGEGSDYSESRVAGELATFVHLCDTMSARIWYDYGKDKIVW